jgi:formate C-acetyltransferase
VLPEGRPVRLREETRLFAWESLQGKYGDEVMAFDGVHMDDVPGFGLLSKQEQYDLALIKIASEAPLRICSHEAVSGAATCGLAVRHFVPAMYGGEPLWVSVSHMTLGFDRVLYEGMDAIEAKINDAWVLCPDNSELSGMINAIRAMRIWHKRYIDALGNTRPDIAEILSRVPFEPAQNFHEAVQSLWFTFAFTRLCGNWSGIGRIDEMLGPYLEQDMERGLQTPESAREILASFFIKGCEWIQSKPEIYGGDAQHYQNIVLAGVDKNGDEITNTVTYLVLEIVEELGISDFPIAVRVNAKTPKALLFKIVEVIRHGGGVVAVYNESLIINALTDNGYTLEEARCFANDGCWEVIMPGKTRFSYVAFDALQLLLENTLRLSNDPACYENMDELYDAFLNAMEKKIAEIYTNMTIHFTGGEPGIPWLWRTDTDGKFDWLWPPMVPCSVVSLFSEGCIASGRSYLQGGSTYVMVSPHIGGAPDVGNSLFAIKKLVFEEGKITFPKLMQILRNNWEGNEELRQYALNKYDYFGNDNDEADAFTTRVLDDFANIVLQYKGKCPVQFPPGVSTFGRQIEWAPYRAAVPFGRKRGEILSGNLSPTPSTDTQGATAVIKSYCKANHRKLSNGSALDVKLHPSAVTGKNGVQALVSLVEGFVALGGFFMQADIMDAEILRLAQERPEDYKTLSVRISGWNARFVTLDKTWQKMIIERTAQRTV